MEQKFKIVTDRIFANKALSNDKLCRANRIKIERIRAHFDNDKVWSFFIENFAWVVNLGVLKTSELIEWFTEEELNNHGIFSTGSHEVQNGSFIGIGNAHLISSMYSVVMLFDNASAECYDTSFLTCYNKSKGNVTDCMAIGMHDSKIVANGSRVELFDNSKCINEGESLIIQR